jgi:transposase
MAESRECPLCGGTMQLQAGAVTVLIPGNPKPTVKPRREWVCPDCDHFEDADEEGA